MDEWYCQQTGTIAGPYSLEELQFLQARGRLAADDRVRRGACGPWIPAQRVPGLFHTAPDGREAAPTNSAASPRDATGRKARSTRPGKAAAASEPGENSDADPEMSNRTAPQRPPLPRRTPRLEWHGRMAIGAGIGGGLVLLLLLLLAIALLMPAAGRQGTLAGADGPSGTGSPQSSKESPGAAPEDFPGPETADAPVEPEAETTSQAAQEGGSQPPSSPKPAKENSAAETAAEMADASPADVANPQPPASNAFTIEKLNDPGDNQESGGGGGAEFFGVKSKGSRIVYVVDRSSSMEGAAFEKACRELLGSLQRLKPRQKFYVIFFSDRDYPMYSVLAPERELVAATRENKQRATAWIENMEVWGGTYPDGALVRALELEPDVIYFLTDGDFESSVVDMIRDCNQRRTVINTVAFMHQAGEPLLKQIARENRGEYRFVP